MTYKEITTMISTIGLSYAYRFFPENSAPPLPYIVFYYPSNDDFAADNVNYVPIVNVNIELYTENKDFETEASVESVLNANRLFFVKTETYLNSEEMFEVLYQMQIPITEGELNGE